MSDRPPLKLVDPEAARFRLGGDPQPGCGLGLYAILLLVICLIGLVGMGLGGVGLLAQLSSVNPKELTSGSQVDAWRLQPLRDADVLGADESPLAWHDESADLSGDPACALLADRVIRVSDGQGRALRYDQIASVQPEALGGGQELIFMTAKADSGQQDLACRFGPHEGARDMLRQVQVELLKLERGQ